MTLMTLFPYTASVLTTPARRSFGGLQDSVDADISQSPYGSATVIK
jgi:hypothetical protein